MNESAGSSYLYRKKHLPPRAHTQKLSYSAYSQKGIKASGGKEEISEVGSFYRLKLLGYWLGTKQSFLT